MLLVMEWLALRLLDPVILVVGALMDAQGKIMYPLVALLRIARHFGRTCEDDTTSNLEGLEGVDRILVGSGPIAMARRAVAGMVVYVLLEVLVPVSLMVAHFSLFHDELSV